MSNKEWKEMTSGYFSNIKYLPFGGCIKHQSKQIMSTL